MPAALLRRCIDGFEPASAHHHQTVKNQPFGVGFFLPATACLRGLLRILADFKVSPVWQSQPIFSLRLCILSPRPLPGAGRSPEDAFLNPI
jgi:hypothetical protein